MAHGDFDWKDMFLTRRELLSRMGNGFAALGLTGLLSDIALAEWKSKQGKREKETPTPTPNTQHPTAQLP